MLMWKPAIYSSTERIVCNLVSLALVESDLWESNARREVKLIKRGGKQQGSGEILLVLWKRESGVRQIEMAKGSDLRNK